MLEGGVIDQHHHNLGCPQGSVKRHQLRAGARERLGQVFGEGLDHEDALPVGMRQRLGDFERGAFAEVVDVGLEGEAEQRDLALRRGSEQRADLRFGVHRLVIIDLARGPHQPGGLGRARHQKPRIDRDAMPAHTGAGLQDVDARVAVCEPDHVPHVHPDHVGDHRQFVGEGDVDVAEAVLDQFHRLGHAGGGVETVALDEAGVEHPRTLGAGGGDAADDAIIMHQFVDDPPRQHALGAIGERNVGLLGRAIARHHQIGARCGDDFGHALGGADRRGALDDHAGTGQDFGRNGAGGGFDIGDVGRIVVAQRGRHGDHVETGGRHFGGGHQRARSNRVVHQLVEIAFLDVHAAGVDRFDHALRDIDPADIPAIAGQQRGGWQADIAEADHRDLMVGCRMEPGIDAERSSSLERCIHGFTALAFASGTMAAKPLKSR